MDVLSFERWQQVLAKASDTEPVRVMVCAVRQHALRHQPRRRSHVVVRERHWFSAHCPHFTRLSSGEILLTHRLPLTALYISRDEGMTWRGPYQIEATPGGYPSTVELKDGTVLVVSYEEGAGSAVRARRFKVKRDGIEFLGLE